MRQKNGFLLGVVKSLSVAVCGVATFVASSVVFAWDSKDFVVEKDGVYSICLKNAAGDVALRSPAEGLWSVATAWENGAPSGWKHIQAKELRTFGDATILTGELELDGGKLSVRDVYSLENGLFAIPDLKTSLRALSYLRSVLLPTEISPQPRVWVLRLHLQRSLPHSCSLPR